MGANYVIFGKTVRPHVLALATLGSVAAGIAIPKFLPKDEPIQQANTPIQSAVETVKDGAAKAAETVKAGSDKVTSVVTGNSDDIDVEKLINDFVTSVDDRKQ
ncbi:Hypothetical protein PP7435_CHR3-1199 [Komagataella phaffii CBS 7435]|uniref:Uncharacterized protein n=1 Tax=Komagataella phaffii (strain ATCC 76273 / CBS 7435 / CECT 11047 / NRRL Y-11430 / Wegner 21-1) TaxID=981350 RepID=F2QXL3_KOMPC|nr:Hypothetical protein BQ9382_C3-6325 [Komagataella phaffii CBS 7435]CCA40141.1 Hypothetical protein PP7435_CHR3-1199 [Komagataella phaffii CBS 7435]